MVQKRTPWKKSHTIFKTFEKKLTVHGPCIHGSPSICIGNLLVVVMVTLLHCANRLPDSRSPVLTWPMCRQLSNPMTSIRLSPISVGENFTVSPGVLKELSVCVLVSSNDESVKDVLMRISEFVSCVLWLCRYRPWIAAVKSTELKLLVLSSLSGRFFRLPRRWRVWCSPQRFEPPWVKGMFSKATPWSEGPCARSKGVPSH